jgi:EAL and modified HD-GYP domain-containing signal transduction protein
MDSAAEHQAIANAMLEIGLRRLVGDKPAFVNLSPEMLHSICVQLLPADRVVLELLEDTEYGPETAKRVAELRKMGYRLAYDDFTFQPHQLPFVPHVDIVKIDVLDTPWSTVKREAQKIRVGHANITLLAEKVEDRTMFDQCLTVGFDLFQGYYFAKPQTFGSKGLDSRKLAILKLLSKLNKPDVSAHELEAVIALDPGLAARLLKLVNCASFGVSRKVDSIFLAIRMLGLERLQAFATVLAAASATNCDTRAVGDLGLIRARMCERVAKELGHQDLHKHFTVGLLSVLDALMDLPMSQIVPELSLSDDVTAALMAEGEGELIEALRLVTAYESGEWSDLPGDLPLDSLSEVYSAAVESTSALAAI